MRKVQRSQAKPRPRERRRFSADRGSIWQLQDAKQRLSEVMQCALSKGPQHITLHGKPAGVLLSEEEYARLGGDALTEQGRFRTGKDLLEWFRNSAFLGVKLELRRSREVVRKVDLGDEA